MIKKLTRHLILIVIFGIFVLSFVFDWLGLKNLGLFNFLGYIHEGLSVLAIWLIYLYLKNFPQFRQQDVFPNLKMMAFNISIIYLIILILKVIFKPKFITLNFPPQAGDLKTIIYSNIVSLLGLFSMIAFILNLRNLIFYKPKKNTKFYFYSSLVFLTITALLTSILKTPLNLTFSGTKLYNNGTFVLTLIFLFLLALHNSWITYLSRKQKFYLTFFALLFLWGASYLFDFAYELPLAYHSLAQAVFINGSWFFLFFYALTSSVYLILQLPTARVFERKMQEVKSLQNLSRAISVELDTNKLTNLITEMIINVTKAPVSWIEFFQPESKTFTIRSPKNLPIQDVRKLEKGQLKNLSEQILKDKKTLVLNKLTTKQKKELFSGFRTPIASLVVTPIIGIKDQFYGLLYAAKSTTFGFTPDDVNLLEAFANQVAIALENADLLQKSFQQQRLEKELQIAREVQLRLLPQTIPALNSYQITTETLTAYEVGGDYFDFIYKPQKQLGLVIGDVSGKGTSAAFYMAEVKGIIQSIAQQNRSPFEILTHTNRVLSSSLEKKSFVTLTFALLDLEAHQMTFVRAGHCPLVHFKAQTDTTFYYQPKGIAVGLDSGSLFEQALEEQTIHLAPGDIVVFYTDGLSEAMNKNFEEYGEYKLSSILKNFKNYPVEKIKEKLIEDVLNFVGEQNLHDDLTLIILKRME